MVEGRSQGRSQQKYSSNRAEFCSMAGRLAPQFTLDFVPLGGHQNFALAGMVGRADDPFLLHALDD